MSEKGFPPLSNFPGQGNNFLDQFKSWFLDCFGGKVCDIACDEETGDLVVTDFRGKELLRKPWQPSDEKSIYGCGPVDEMPAPEESPGMCIYLNETDGCVYYRRKNGTWYSPEKQVNEG